MTFEPESAPDRNAISHARKDLQENIMDGKAKSVKETWRIKLPSQLSIFVYTLWRYNLREELTYRNQFQGLISVSSADILRVLEKE